MKTLTKLSLAVAGAATMGSVAATFGISEAYAIKGSISFSGAVTGLSTAPSPLTDTINFSAPTNVNGGEEFESVSISFLEPSFMIRRVGSATTTNAPPFTTTTGLYSFEAIDKFIEFSNGYRFALDAGTLDRSYTAFGKPPLVTLSFDGLLTGRFIKGADEVVGLGNLSLTAVPDVSSYTVSITSTPIPTPALLPGLIGMGVAALRRKQNDETAEENA